MAPKFDPLTPMWWVYRLHKQLCKRQPAVDLLDDYYCGNHPLPWLPEAAQDEFRRILKMTRSNYMGLVVDAQVERMAIEGFRLSGADPDEGSDDEFDPDQADPETWRIWQANNLDADSDMGILEAAITGQSYMLVAPNPDDEKTPHMWVEHPLQAIVEHVPGTNRRQRAAGLKVWMDDWTGRMNATLYLPDEIYKFTAEKTSNVTPENLRWAPREVAGESYPARNEVGVVPLFEIPNNPRLLTGGVSELIDVTDIQDRINKTLADRLMTQDYGAFPQKWASGWPEADENNQPTPPIDVGRDRMVTTEVTETRFGQWDAAPLDPYSAAKREDVKDIASRTRTPSQYLLGEMSNVNGETLKASESGLISKVRRRCRSAGEPIEAAVSLARRIAGLSVDPAVETIWRNPQYRTEGEVTDAAIKRFQAGISSRRQTREDVGYSATQIKRLEQDDDREAADPLLAQALQRVATGASDTAGA